MNWYSRIIKEAASDPTSMSKEEWLKSKMSSAPSLLYHGTPHNFESLKPNPYGVIWLTPDKEAAKSYSNPYYNPGHGRIISVELSPLANVVNLKDLSNPFVKELKEDISNSRRMTWGPISDDSWASFADFGILEMKNGLYVRFLKRKKVDAVVVDNDYLMTSADKHSSIAVLNPNVLVEVNP